MGSEGQKLSYVILEDLVEMKNMLKSASKNIIFENCDLPVITVCKKL